VVRAARENPVENESGDLEIALDRLIRLYDGWGKPEESAKCRTERDALLAARPSR
jgi:hypothetical protein